MEIDELTGVQSERRREKYPAQIYIVGYFAKEVPPCGWVLAFLEITILPFQIHIYIYIYIYI